MWGIDVPASELDSLTENFKNKCLLTCALLGKLQNEYFEGSNKKFLALQYLNSKTGAKKKVACKLLFEEMSILIEKEELPQMGPYELASTLAKLTVSWNCQFFIFEGVSSSKSKLKLMVPPVYCDSLAPIYLYKIFGSNHIVFIQNINSYFKQNGKICFACNRTFKSSKYQHFCQSKKSCFVCHRFIKTQSTYVNIKIEGNFCDSLLVPQITQICNLCNCRISSQSCVKAHRRLCNSRGFFGWFCETCETFTYHSGSLRSDNLKKTTYVVVLARAGTASYLIMTIIYVS